MNRSSALGPAPCRLAQAVCHTLKRSSASNSLPEAKVGTCECLAPDRGQPISLLGHRADAMELVEDASRHG